MGMFIGEHVQFSPNQLMGQDYIILLTVWSSSSEQSEKENGALYCSMRH